MRTVYLGAEGVPDTVLDLGDSTILVGGTLNRDTLLTVDSLTRGQVLGNKHVFLAATSDKDTGMTVGLLSRKKNCSVADLGALICSITHNDNFGTTTGTTTTAGSTTSTRSATTTARSTTATT